MMRPTGAARGAGPATEVPWIRGIRAGNVKDVEVINVSSTGVLVQCQARLVPGQEALLQIVGASNKVRVKGQVVRCEVSDVRGDLQYHVAVRFDPDPCPLPVSAHLSASSI